MTTSVKGQVDGRNTPGWGMDADPDNNPTYPMRDVSKDDQAGMTWVRPSQQPAVVEVLKSTEHRNLTAVFGTSVPPSGLSGVLRRSAFKRSESKWTHWLLLLGADRINVVEGLFGDVFHGRFPNILGEMGVRSELRHNKTGFVRKLVLTLLVLTVLVALVWVIFD